MLVERWPQLRRHPIQAEVMTCLKRFLFIAAGRQSGKTELALRNLVMWLPVKKRWRRPQYFYSGPTLKQARRVAWDRLLELIPPHWIAGISLTDDRIKTVFGSELFLEGLDAPQRIEGQILDGGIVDENADVKPGTYARSVHGTLVTKRGWCWRIGVCKRHGVGADEFRTNFEKAANGELPDSAAFTWPSSTVLMPDEVKIAQSMLDEKTFEEQYNATWLNASGGVFHAFDREFNVRPCAYDTNLPIVVGMDFNVNPMAFVLCHDKAGVVEVFDEVWMRDTNTPAALAVMVGRYPNHRGGWQIYGDASGRARKTSAYATDIVHVKDNVPLRQMGRTVHFDKSNPPVADRFAATNARICNGAGERRVFVDNHCKHLIHDLEIRTYKPGTREADDSGDIGHPTDALGYFLYKRFPLVLHVPNKQVITIVQGA